jgi:AbrB family looped-hinge helix DNA binding protein
MRSRVCEDGQVTIPRALRDELGIRPGEILDFEAEDGRLVATKPGVRDPFDAAFGILDLPEGTDAVVKDLHGPG